MINLDHTQLAKLASELAMKAKPAAQTFKDFGLKAGDFAELKENSFFIRAFEAAVIEWNQAMNAPQRIKIGSAVILEDAMPILGARMKNPDTPLPAAVEAAKFFARNAGIGESEATQAPGERFIITINLGNDEKLKYNKSIAPNPNDIDLAANPKLLTND